MDTVLLEDDEVARNAARLTARKLSTWAKATQWPNRTPGRMHEVFYAPWLGSALATDEEQSSEASSWRLTTRQELQSELSKFYRTKLMSFVEEDWMGLLDSPDSDERSPDTAWGAAELAIIGNATNPDSELFELISMIEQAGSDIQVNGPESLAEDSIAMLERVTTASYSEPDEPFEV